VRLQRSRVFPCPTPRIRWKKTSSRWRSSAAVPLGHKSSSGASFSCFVFNVARRESELVGEVWVDPTRVDAVSDLPAILEKLSANETVELSTGFPARLQRVEGVHNGEQYDAVLEPTGFDHLAIFAQKTGACSVDDGCGLGVNEDAPPPDRAQGDLASVYAVLGLADSTNDTKPEADEPPAGDQTPPQEGQTMNRDAMIAALASVVAL